MAAAGRARVRFYTYRVSNRYNQDLGSGSDKRLRAAKFRQPLKKLSYRFRSPKPKITDGSFSLIRCATGACRRLS